MIALLRRLFGCPHSTRREYIADRLTLICDDCGRRWPVDVTDADVASRLEARRQQARAELREANNRQRIAREREAWRRQSAVTSIETRRRTR
jgi:hypothetical protein